MRAKKTEALTLADIFQSSEVKRRLLFTLSMLLLFRLGAFIPIPCIPQDLLANNPLLTGNLINMYDLFAGGSLKALSIFALGIGPYISASIVVQLMGKVHPYLKGLREEGEYGQRKLKKVTRYLTLFLAFVESFGIARALGAGESMHAILPQPVLMGLVMFTLSVGSMLVMWMSELISEHGIGNGASLFICTGIVMRLPQMVQDTWVSVDAKQVQPWAVSIMVAILFFVGVLAVLLQQGMKKLPVLGGRPRHSRLSRQGNDTYLYLPMNPAGVMPVVFASQVLFFLHMFVTWLIEQLRHFGDSLFQDRIMAPIWTSMKSNDIFHSLSFTIWAEMSNAFDYAHLEYYVLYTALIFFFSLFYSEIILPPLEIAESLRKSNRVLDGVRPGRPTVVFLRSTIQRLALSGAAAISFIALVPMQVAQLTQVQTLLGFGSTSLIILTGVALDTQRQISACAASSRYHKRYLLPPSKSDNLSEEEEQS